MENIYYNKYHGDNMSTAQVEIRLDNIEKELETLRDRLNELSADHEDHKEAFEHVDDSLSNLRVAVSSIKMENKNGA